MSINRLQSITTRTIECPPHLQMQASIFYTWFISSVVFVLFSNEMLKNGIYFSFTHNQPTVSQTETKAIKKATSFRIKRWFRLWISNLHLPGSAIVACPKMLRILSETKFVYKIHPYQFSSAYAGDSTNT